MTSHSRNSLNYKQIILSFTRDPEIDEIFKQHTPEIHSSKTHFKDAVAANKL